MGAEEIGKFGINTNGTIAEERVFFLGNVQVRDLLIAADVHCAKDDRLALRGEQHLLIGFELLLLVRRGVSVHIQHFSAKQPDTLRAAGKRPGRFQRAADVGGNLYRYVVAGECWKTRIFDLLLVASVGKALRHAVVIIHRVVGFNDQHATDAVQNDLFSHQRCQRGDR
ncbi:Uncharacterised protein [Enterobacter cloacae]|nr:Uncharacterised protein [Enterobacter cloacae]